MPHSFGLVQSHGFAGGLPPEAGLKLDMPKLFLSFILCQQISTNTPVSAVYADAHHEGQS